MEGNTVKLMNEFLRDYIEDLEITNSNLSDILTLVRQDHFDTVNVMMLIIYMYKKRMPSIEDIPKELSNPDFMSKLIKFDLKQGDEKYFNVIKEYRSTKIGTAENAGKINDTLKAFVEWIDLVIKFKSQFY